MPRSVRLAFASLACFLVLLPLSLKKPGLPVKLVGDEATYVSMAASLAGEADLRCDRADLERLFAAFPFGQDVRLELTTDDNWASARFDRPVIYPVLATPFVALWGANGPIVLNAICFLLALACGWFRLRQVTSEGLALLYCLGFFLFSTAFSYIFRMQPQIMVMAAVSAALALGWRDSQNEQRPPAFSHRWWLSGAALGLATLQEPVLVVLAVPLLAGLWRGHRRNAILWLAGIAVMIGIGVLLSVGLTGSAWSQHRSGDTAGGVATKTVTLDNPVEIPWLGLGGQDAVQEQATGAPRSGMALLEDGAFFLWGRRTGILPYFPLIIPILVLFTVAGRQSRSRETWLLLAALAALGVLQLMVEPVSRALHEAQVGNPHMVGVYPAFLLLISRLPRTMIVASFGLGALVLGPLVSSSLGVVVPGAGIHFHTRNLPIRLLPLEYPALGRASGFRHLELYGLDQAAGETPARLWAPADQFEARGDEHWLLGGESVELWLESRAPIPSAVFQLRNLASGNRISMRMAGEKITRDFDQVPPEGTSFRIELEPSGPDKVRDDLEDRGPVYYYRVSLATRIGEKPKWRQHTAAKEYLGVAVAFLGTREFLAQDLYAAKWQSCGAPPRVEPEEEFLAAARLRNLSQHAWPNRGPARVRFAYRWLAATGEGIPHASLRTELPAAVEPGQEIASWISVVAPRTAGSYTLELDPLFENVDWFSNRDPAATCRVDVRVAE